ncbi:MAG: mechanosensitive ion channel family protein [Microcystaceae cyanobacterium]
MKKFYQRLFNLFCILIFSLTAIAPILSQSLPSPTPSPQPEGTVELFDESLFVLKAPIGGLSVKERAERMSQRLRDFAEDRSLSLAQLEIYDGEEDNIPFSMINAGNILLMLITNNDVKATGKERKELAQSYFDKIKYTVKNYREERNVEYLLKVSFWVVIATFIFIIILIVINNIFGRIYDRLKMWGESYIRPVKFGNWELIRANQLDDVITWIVRLAQTIMILSLLAIYLPFVLEQYPWTRKLARILQGYLLGTLKTIILAFLDYLPSLLIIIFVVAITVCVLRLSRPFFRELGDGTISLPGFYSEWAKPTYRIMTFLIITLASVIIFPLLPGFQSPAFQGISVFLGLVISLGSTSVISNLISGSIIIYTRAFRVGDRIRIGDISGKVLETTLLVTRILTSMNIVISIPNSQISTSSIENFSFGHREFNEPFIIGVSIYLGYEVPWRSAYQALIQAAMRTQGILNSPSPFVLQRELNEVYVTYLLNVYIDVDYFKEKTEKDINQTRSRLHENIQDCCLEAGIKIFAPSYEADPTKYGPNITNQVV